MEIINEYLNVIVLLICLAVGYIIKHIVPGKVINKFIPLINGVLGVGLMAWMSMSFSPTVLVTGLVSGLSSTGFYEMFKQFIEKKVSENIPDGGDE